MFSRQFARPNLHHFGNLLVSTAGLEILSGADDVDDIFAAGNDQLLFGNDQLLFGSDTDLLFGADVSDPDLAALSSVISGSDLTDPVELAAMGLDIIGAGATTPQARRQALARNVLARRRQALLNQAIAQRKQQAAQSRLAGLAQIGVKPTLAVERGYTKARRFPFGLLADGPTLAGQPGSVTRRPQTPIKLARLVIPTLIAPAFWITDIKIGKDSQLVGSDPIPGETFTQNGVGVDLSGDTANVGNDVTVAFVNVSGASQRFHAAIIGPSVE